MARTYRGARQASLEACQLEAKLEPYLRADVFARWRLSAHCALNLRIENLTDVDYIQGSQSDMFKLNPGAPFTAQGTVEFKF